MRASAVTVLPSFALTTEVAWWVADRVAECILEGGTCRLALSGGSTPRPLYEALARHPFAPIIDWDRVNVYFGDERAVPPDHPDSNYRMAYEALLGRVPLVPEHIHRMPAEGQDRDADARAYERLLPPRLDVLLLGMGPDGHTASLFPGSPAVEEQERLVVPVDAPVPPRARMTITPPVIAAARHVAVLVTGPEKAQMVARALEGPRTPSEIPVQVAAAAHWFLDAPAASRLGQRGAG